MLLGRYFESRLKHLIVKINSDAPDGTGIDTNSTKTQYLIAISFVNVQLGEPSIPIKSTSVLCRHLLQLFYAVLIIYG